MDILSIILSSGPVVKLVLLILIFFSIYSWGIVFYYYKYYKGLKSLNSDFSEAFSKSSLENLTSLTEFNSKLEKFSEAPFFKLWKPFYTELQIINEKINLKGNHQFSDYLKDSGVENFERCLEKGTNEAVLVVDKYRSTLASIASVTPFVGLFGTVWGIIHSFTGLAQGGGSLEVIAPGIAEALVATAVGLFAAIPASWFYNVFSKKLKDLKVDMHSFSQDLLNYLKHYSLS